MDGWEIVVIMVVTLFIVVVGVTLLQPRPRNKE